MLLTRIVLAVCLTAGMSTIMAGEPEPREEFKKFADQLDKLLVENAQVEQVNAKIRAENAALKKQIAKINSSSADDVYKPVKERISALNLGTPKSSNSAQLQSDVGRAASPFEVKTTAYNERASSPSYLTESAAKVFDRGMNKLVWARVFGSDSNKNRDLDLPRGTVDMKAVIGDR